MRAEADRGCPEFRDRGIPPKMRDFCSKTGHACLPSPPTAHPGSDWDFHAMLKQCPPNLLGMWPWWAAPAVGIWRRRASTGAYAVTSGWNSWARILPTCSSVSVKNRVCLKPCANEIKCRATSKNEILSCLVVAVAFFYIAVSDARIVVDVLVSDAAFV